MYSKLNLALILAVTLNAAPPTPKTTPPSAPVITSANARTVYYGREDIIPITLRSRFQTMILLPEGEVIVDTGAGDTERWKINTNQHFVYITPTQEDLATTLNLVTGTGNLYSFVLTESARTPPDLKVFIKLTDNSMISAAATPPKFVAAQVVDDFRIQATDALKETQRVREEAAAQVAAAEKKANTEKLLAKAGFPASMKFEYDYQQQPGFNVAAIWHDEKFTYVAANPRESMSLYELQDGKPSMTNFKLNDGLYTVPKIVDRGYLAVGDRKMHFTRKVK